MRDAARACLSAYPKQSGDDTPDPGLQQARGSVQEVFQIAERMAENKESDVLWLAEGTDRIPPRLCVAPLQVWAQMRERLLSDKTVVFASATLKLGGDFDAVASGLGLRADERVPLPEAQAPVSDEDPREEDDTTGEDGQPWRAVDGGSPFDYPKQGIIPHNMGYYAVESTRHRRSFIGRVFAGEAASFQTAMPRATA